MFGTGFPSRAYAGKANALLVLNLNLLSLEGVSQCLTEQTGFVKVLSPVYHLIIPLLTERILL